MSLSVRNLSHSPRNRWLALCAGASFLVLGWIVALLGQSRGECQRLGGEMREAEQAEGEVALIDQRLGTSALLFTETGDARWRDQYEADIARLGGALAHAIEQSTSEETEHQQQSTHFAQARLLAIERTAIKLASAGMLEEAQRLLLQDEYESWKTLHREGLKQRRLDTASRYEASLEVASKEGTGLLIGLQLTLLTALLLTTYVLRLGSKRDKYQAQIAALQRQQDSLVHALDHAPAGIVITDLTTEISYANQQFCELAGRPMESLIGQPAGLLKSGETPDEVYKDIWASLNAGRSWSGRILNRRDVNGAKPEPYWAYLCISPLMNDKSERVGYIGAQQDVSKSVELELAQELRRSLSVTLAHVAACLHGPQEFAERLRCTLGDLMGVAGFRGDLGAAVMGWGTATEGNLFTLAATPEFGSHEWSKSGELEQAVELGEAKGTQLFLGLGGKSLSADELAGFLLVPFGDDDESRGLLVIGCDASLIGDSSYSEMLDSLAHLFSRAVLQWRLGDKLERALAEANQANRAKSAFLANMSHEIRTPMTSILGYAELLLETDRSAAERDQAGQVIRKSAEELLGMINGILDISKVESGSLQLERDEFSPLEMATSVVAAHRAPADKRKLTLEMRVTGSVPRTIKSDPSRLRQVLNGLVDNAIKFTEQGGVTLVMSCEPRGSSVDLIFDVVDTGIGVPLEQSERIFEAFRQADNSLTRRFGGVGLGLTIARNFARLLGGEITLQDNQTQGSTFRVRLKAGQNTKLEMISPDDPSREALASESHGPEVSTIPYGLLLAEDNLVNQTLIKRILQRAGARVEAVGNGAEAVAAAVAAEAAGNPFEAILMDLMMPELDGLSATTEIRQLGLGLPIIALTADAMDGTQARCLEAGCDGYATKPVNRPELFGLLHKLIEQQRVSP